jgi:hypothetical protein
MLPEGVRTDDAITIWSEVELHTAKDGVREADKVTARDEVWEVHSVRNWKREGGFFKSVCIKVGQ